VRGPHLIHNWRKAWRMLSVQAMAVAGAVQAAWAVLPDDMKTTVPPTLVQWLTLVLLALGIGGRVIDQPKTKG